MQPSPGTAANPLAASAQIPQVWRRLSPWGIAIKPIKQLPRLIPALVSLVVFANAGAPVIGVIVAAAIVAFIGLMPWLTTTYQVTEAHLQVRTGLINRRVVTARRDRIRTIDTIADPFSRALGLRTLHIGTAGGGEDAMIKLASLKAPIADALKDDLLRRTPRSEQREQSETESAATAPPVSVTERELARFAPAWIRFAPFSLTGFVTVLAIVGIGFRTISDLNLDDASANAASSTFHRIRNVHLYLLIPGAIVGVIVIAIVFSVLAYIVAFWGFRIARRSDGTLVMRRGLVTVTTSSLEEKRIRGVILHEPVLMRIPKGAKLFAIASGVTNKRGSKATRHHTLLPPAPLLVARELAEQIVGGAGSMTRPLVRHGKVARRRRLTRSFIVAGLATLVVVVAGLSAGANGASVAVIVPCCAVLVALIVVGSFRIALARYANLGHDLTSQLILMGTPSIGRRRFAIERDGVVGWTFRESFFQKRAGVVTAFAATAGGSGAYGIVDMSVGDATQFTYAATPDMMLPFLERR